MVQSAAANAGNIEGMDTESLYISYIVVNEGPTMKRFMPRAMGRASMILKRTSHVDVKLQDRVKIEKKSELPAKKSDEVLQEEVSVEKKDDKQKKTTEKKQTTQKKSVKKKTEKKKTKSQ